MVNKIKQQPLRNHLLTPRPLNINYTISTVCFGLVYGKHLFICVLSPSSPFFFFIFSSRTLPAFVLINRWGNAPSVERLLLRRAEICIHKSRQKNLEQTDPTENDLAWEKKKKNTPEVGTSSLIREINAGTRWPPRNGTARSATLQFTDQTVTFPQIGGKFTVTLRRSHCDRGFITITLWYLNLFCDLLHPDASTFTLHSSPKV